MTIYQAADVFQSSQPAGPMGYYANYPVRTRAVGELTTGETIWSALSLAGTAAGAYHGYKRNNSIGWAFVWALMGSIAPIITVPVALAQGFGKPKRG